MIVAISGHLATLLWPALAYFGPNWVPPPSLFTACRREKSVGPQAKRLGCPLGNALIEERALKLYVLEGNRGTRQDMVSKRQKPVTRIGDWIFETNEILEISFVSDRFEKTTGLSQSHIMGWTLPALMLSDPTAGRGEDRTFNLDDRHPFDDAVCSLKGLDDGSVYHFSVSAKPYFGPGGIFRGYRGAAHNITLEIENETVGKSGVVHDASTSVLLNEMSESGDAVISYDSEGTILFCNDPYRNFYPGIASMLQPGTKLWDVLCTSAKLSGLSEDPAVLNDWVEERLNERLNPSGDVEEHYINSRWWQIQEYTTLDGTIINRRRDITREKMDRLKPSSAAGPADEPMDSSLLASGAQYILTEVVDALEEGFALYDSNDHLIVANVRYGEMLGLADDLLIPGTLFNVIMVAVSEEALPDADDETKKDWREPFLGPLVDFVPENVTLRNGHQLRMNVRETEGGLLAHTLIDTSPKNHS